MTAGVRGRDLGPVWAGSRIPWQAVCDGAGGGGPVCDWSLRQAANKSQALRLARAHVAEHPTHRAVLTAQTWQRVYGPGAAR